MDLKKKARPWRSISCATIHFTKPPTVSLYACVPRAAAIRAYHTCASRLERELGIAPSEATRRIYEVLLPQDASPQAVTSSRARQQRIAPLVGRRALWQQLQAAWHRAADGHPHFVLLSGEASIGKTRLAEEMEAWVSRQGMTTATAHCYAAEGRLPYAPVTTWLRADALHAVLLTLDPIFSLMSRCSHLGPIL